MHFASTWAVHSNLVVCMILSAGQGPCAQSFSKAAATAAQLPGMARHIQPVSSDCTHSHADVPFWKVRHAAFKGRHQVELVSAVR